MELSHSLLLNEEALSQIADSKKSIFVYEWLRFLDKVLSAAHKSDIKEQQKTLVKQLRCQVLESHGPPSRLLLGKCFANIYHIGDTFSMFETVNFCNDIIKSKDDSPSYLPTRLAAVAIIGAMYERLGRMVGSSFMETIQNLIKALKNAESTGRCEIMLCLEKILQGLGSAGHSCHKDIYKAARAALQDRTMAVRCAAAQCLLELHKEAVFMYTTELETVVSFCYRALDGSNYDVRSAVAKLLGVLLATTQTCTLRDPKLKKTSMIEALNLLAAGFVKGPTGLFKGGGTGEYLKSGTVNREVRVGVTHAYVVFVRTLGGLWLDRNISVFLTHVLELLANPKATQTHVDAVYSRKCVTFIIRSLIGEMLGEKAQVSAAKELCAFIAKQMNLLGDNPIEGAADNRPTIDASNTQHVLISALQELGSLVKGLSTCAAPLLTDTANNICDTVSSVLLHPSHSARLAAAWCLRCIATALPSQLSPLLDRCIDNLQHLRGSPEAVSGYSGAITALLGGVRECPLGLPHSKGKAIFNVAEDLLRTAAQNSRMSLHRTQAGWLILAGVMTLGSPVVKNHLPKLLLLWRNAFPRSSKELESEKARGDAFTWQVTLEGRAGALCAMESFIEHCKEIVTEDVIRRLMTPLECAMSMLADIHGVIKSYGAHLKACAAMVRLRLYKVLRLIPPTSYESSFNVLLRELVAEFTLTDNPANTTTSLLRHHCHVEDSIILQSWIQDTDHKVIEIQLQPNSASGSGALEHDPSCMYWTVSEGEAVPGPLPLGVAVIDASVALYGVIFPYVADKHRMKMLEHFAECIRQAKSTRQQAVQINIFTAVLSALKGLAENKRRLKDAKVRVAANNLIMSALTNQNPILRCAAGEALGRMEQVGGDNNFIAQTAQMCFDRLKSARDVVSRTGNSLALGCLHRYVGGMGAGQHLNTSVSILLALAQDITSPTVQMWALHALALIADSGGPMFRSYVEPTLSLVLNLLLTVPPFHIEVHQCLGRCLAALITTLGPELQGNRGNIATARFSCLVGCAIMQNHPDSLVASEAISCLQQLHMFAPRHVNLSTLVPHLCNALCSPHLLLRRAAVACLRQLSQREAREVSDYAMSLAKDSNDNTGPTDTLVITETGLEGVLFGMLDKETDNKLRSDIHDTLISMLLEMAGDNLTRWLALCKSVLSDSKDSAAGTPGQNDNNIDGNDNDEGGDDDTTFHTGEKVITHPTVPPRWPTKMFAVESVRRVFQVCNGITVHFDLALAREKRTQTNKSDYLVLHLSDLVRMAFMSATANSDQLRKSGLLLLADVINKFAKVPEPEFPGHFIMEQYQAQVGAALRPAFSQDTPSDVTAMACQVSSTWIGSGVAHDLNDLRRVHQLLVSSLSKLQAGKGSSLVYSESASTMEKLAVIKAWAEVYIVAMQQHNSTTTNVDEDNYTTRSSDDLLDLVKPELNALSKCWIAALRDHALLSLPSEFSSQLPTTGGAFYNAETIESVRGHYQKSWAPIMYAAALWLNTGGFDVIQKERSDSFRALAGGPVAPSTDLSTNVLGVPNELASNKIKNDNFHLILGICVESISSPRSSQPVENVTYCVKALYTILDSTWPRSRLMSDRTLAVELLNVMHRLLLTRDSVNTHLLILKVVRQVLQAFTEKMAEQSNSLENGNDTIHPNHKKPLGEGGEDGVITPGKSIVFATLEVCLCTLIRQIPALNPAMPTNSMLTKQRAGLSEEANQLISETLSVMTTLPKLCSPKGSVSVLPTILFLTTGVLRETACSSTDGIIPSTVTASLQSLKLLASSPLVNNPDCSDEWVSLLQSSFATILDSAKPGSDVDVCSMLLALAVFTTSAPAKVSMTTSLQKQTIEVFKQAFLSDKVTLRLKCLQTLSSIFQCPKQDVSAPYIHAMGPKIVEYLHNMSGNQRDTDDEALVAIEACKTLELLVSLTEEAHRVQLMAVYLPILIGFLIDSTSLTTATKPAKSLHDHSLQRLMKIAPLYPAPFKTVMGAAPQLKTKLEGAIRANQAMLAKKPVRNAKQQMRVAMQAAPSIKLKKDFSNFNG
ncbi:HEAT repeat-containing protein 5B-like isoform X2 [Antedon mediterranea]|uniref:HEAT repeat-containing protein 5B-like isoform X2 n=1 Tax=Antedon mediterranea TaxID=105859 RepID=UPI003AF95DC3